MVPPPNPTESEKVQRDYFESTIKLKERWIEMNQQITWSKCLAEPQTSRVYSVQCPGMFGNLASQTKNCA